MNLEQIGFYTLSDYRAQHSSLRSPMWRGEILLTDKCNFSCPYCRGLREDCRGEKSASEVKRVIKLWADDGLKNIRFSGGEPTQYPNLRKIVRYAKSKGIKRIALSTNGSAHLDYYWRLLEDGVNDFSISLDACCSMMGEKMSGDSCDWRTIVDNIRWLSKATYVTAGIVFTSDNVNDAKNIIEFAHSLGVADIRIISSAQYNQAIKQLDTLDKTILDKHPILKYRVKNYLKPRNVRGIRKHDFTRCPLVLDDSAVAGKWHFPCIIYLREQGNPIGKVNRIMRQERYMWYLDHNTHEDEICQKNCLDVCIDYNNTWKGFHKP